MAAAKFNKDGGVFVKQYGKKIPLEISILDMETNPEKAIARAEAFNQQGASIVCGTTMMSGSSDVFERISYCHHLIGDQCRALGKGL